jgi:hypothetical protein
MSARSPIDDGGPAFPMRSYEEWGGEEKPGQRGMALREYFAAHAPNMPPALREIAKRQETRDGKDTSDFGAYARLEADWRYAYADAMLRKARPQS